MTQKPITRKKERGDSAGAGSLMKLIIISMVIALAILISLDLNGSLERRVPGVAQIPLTSDWQSLNFEMKEDAVVQVWAYLEIEHEGISPSTPHNSLPHVMNIVVEIEDSDGEKHLLRCNPFNSNYSLFSAERRSMGAPFGRMYDGLIRDCSARLHRGLVTARVRKEAAGNGDSRIRFKMLELILRKAE